MFVTQILPDRDSYRISQPETLPSPRLVIFLEKVKANLDLMRAYLDAIAPGSGFEHLCPHVKTIKSPFLTRLLMQAGITYFKCTPNELDMLMDCGARNIFIAYPLTLYEANRVASLVREHPDLQIEVQIGHNSHAEILARAAQQSGIEWNYFIDLDVGMHRTGIAPCRAWELYQEIADFGALHLVGLHAYDGHNSSDQPGLRAAVARRCMDAVTECFRDFQGRGVPLRRVVAAGTPGFRPALDYLLHTARPDCQVCVSPGTWVLWDSGYNRLMPGEFEIAALLLAQVMDIPDSDRLLTLNLGYKRWAIDQGPVEIFDGPGLEFVKASEEHTVLLNTGERSFAIGDYLLVAPHHVCPTMNLWEDFTVIGADGAVIEERSPVTGRNR